MTAQQLLNTGTSLGLRSKSFSSAHWLSYFQGNKSAGADVNFPEKISLPLSMQVPIIRSLQRFQIGETGDGKHLKKYASETHDPTYEQCIDLFVKEEQGHAGILAQMIKSMDGTLLSWHWSDLVFVAVRRMLGLKTELFILLIAEIVGKCFYKACADHLDNKLLRDTFSLIVMDEIFHLEFHCSFMARQMLEYPPAFRQAVYFLWSALFYAACIVFIADHRAALHALKVSPKIFLQDCSSTFHRAADKVLL
jgi:hypothetical protein